jgi:hypothetical protein
MKNAQLAKQDDYRKQTQQNHYGPPHQQNRAYGRTITANDQITHTISKTTKTNDPEMIAADHPQEITPTSIRAAHAVQAITTETAHHYMTTKRSTRKLSRPPRSTQHQRKVTIARRVT